MYILKLVHGQVNQQAVSNHFWCLNFAKILYVSHHTLNP